MILSEFVQDSSERRFIQINMEREPKKYHLKKYMITGRNLLNTVNLKKTGKTGMIHLLTLLELKEKTFQVSRIFY